MGGEFFEPWGNSDVFIIKNPDPNLSSGSEINTKVGSESGINAKAGSESGINAKAGSESGSRQIILDHRKIDYF